MPQQEDSFVVFESIPLIYRVVKLSEFLRTPFGNIINVLGKLFCTTIVKVIGKRKPFKPMHNSSEVLYGLHISNDHTMGGERCVDHFGGKLHNNSCHSQLC